MRAAAIFGLGTSSSDLQAFQSDSGTTWTEGLPASSSDADAVVIFGGDGTIHRHLSAFVRLRLPVLIVPSGSGNDFARALNLRSLRDSLNVWRNFESGIIQAQPVDLGVIRSAGSPESASSSMGRYFCSVAGCGLGSITTRRANRMPRWLRGHGGYVLALTPALLNLPAYPMRITRWNGSEELRDENPRPTLLAAFANTQFYGDGMRIAPQADMADGQLDICRISAVNAFEFFCLFPTVYYGTHQRSPKVECSRADRARVESDIPLEIYGDGEFVCETPAEISVAAGTLQVLAPPLS